MKRIISLLFCLAGCASAPGAEEVQFAGQAYFPVAAKELSAALSGKVLEYDPEDGLGHFSIPFHGPENFEVGGGYHYTAHRGWEETGRFWVHGVIFCVRVQRLGTTCRKLYRTLGGRFLVQDEKDFWPVKLTAISKSGRRGDRTDLSLP
jgi:hypothetical protein